MERTSTDARHGPQGRSGRRGRTAVVGSGVAGLTAAHVLGRSRHVTLYEADDRLGGHAHTHELTRRRGVWRKWQVVRVSRAAS